MTHSCNSIGNDAFNTTIKEIYHHCFIDKLFLIDNRMSLLFCSYAITHIKYYMQYITINRERGFQDDNQRDGTRLQQRAELRGGRQGSLQGIRD